MRGFFATTSHLGNGTGGGSVSQHELNAFRNVCDVVDVASAADSKQQLYDFDLDVATKINRKYDIAHFNGCPFPESVARLKSLNSKVKIVAAVPAHSLEISMKEHQLCGLDYEKLYPHIVGDNFKRFTQHVAESDLVIYPSVHSQKYLRLKLGSLENEHITIPHGVDLVNEPIYFPNRFGVGYIGAAGPDKGLRYLVEAWEKLNPKEAVLYFFGFQSSGVEHWIRKYAPSCSRYILYDSFSNLKEIMSQIHIGVFPSVIEGFNLGVLECLAHGRPVIVSGGAGASELIMDQREGFLVSIRDSNAIAKAIKKLLDMETHARMSIAARKTAAQYPWHRIEQSYVEVYSGLLS